MLDKHIKSAGRWIISKQTPLSMIVGSGITAVWTILRHITNGINFDVIGQIGVAEQWAEGLHGGATFGTTNYVLKMPLYALVNTFHWLPPLTRILLLALICSVGAYLLIYITLRKIIRLYGVQSDTMLNLGMLWLATIAGRVFWVDYANSRNLEVAGGLTVLYFILSLWEKGASWRRIASLTVFMSVVFFADPLQLYVIGGGIALVALGLFVQRRGHLRQRFLLSIGAILSAALLSRLLAWASALLLPVTYLAPPKSTPGLNWDAVHTIAQNTLTSTARVFDVNIFSKAFTANSLRQIGGALLLVLALYILIRYRKHISGKPVRIVWLLITWNYLVYAASGNAITPMTERYLIMVPLLFVALLALHGDAIPRIHLPRLALPWLAIVLASGVLLGGAILLQWQTRYHLDQPMIKLADFVRAHNYDYVIASRELSVPANYYTGYDYTVVPTICLDGNHIITSNLFYDKGRYEKLGTGQGITAVIVPDAKKSPGSFNCDEASVLRQLGTPTSASDISGVGKLYEYDSSTQSLRNLL